MNTQTQTQDHQQPSPTTAPISSVFTTSFGQILAQLNISLAVSTYQAGKVILVSYDDAPNVDGSPGSM